MAPLSFRNRSAGPAAALVLLGIGVLVVGAAAAVGNIPWAAGLAVAVLMGAAWLLLRGRSRITIVPDGLRIDASLAPSRLVRFKDIRRARFVRVQRVGVASEGSVEDRHGVPFEVDANPAAGSGAWRLLLELGRQPQWVGLGVGGLSAADLRALRSILEGKVRVEPARPAGDAQGRLGNATPTAM